MKILMILFWLMVAVWLYLFISWMQCVVKRRQANKREDVDEEMWYSVKGTQLSSWLCVLALVMNILNIVRYLIG